MHTLLLITHVYLKDLLAEGRMVTFDAALYGFCKFGMQNHYSTLEAWLNG